MTVRAAKFADIPAIVDIMAWAHARSRFAHCSTFDPQEAKQLLVRFIQRHGHTNYLGSLVLVSERRDRVLGFCLGILDQLHPCLKELKVTDVFFIMGDGVDPRDARNIVQALTEWGRANPKVVRVLLGATDDISDWTRTGNLYQRCGLEQCGGLYAIEFDRQPEVQRVVSV